MLNNLENKNSKPVVEEYNRLFDIAKDILQDFYCCTRVWEAWNYGTMTEGDFTLCVGDKDIVFDTIASIRKIEEDAKKSEAILFGRWLLKYAKPKWVGDFLCYEYNGNDYDTDELYNIFKQKPFGGI